MVFWLFSLVMASNPVDEPPSGFTQDGLSVVLGRQLPGGTGTTADSTVIDLSTGESRRYELSTQSLVGFCAEGQCSDQDQAAQREAEQSNAESEANGAKLAKWLAKHALAPELTESPIESTVLTKEPVPCAAGASCQGARLVVKTKDSVRHQTVIDWAAQEVQDTFWSADGQYVVVRLRPARVRGALTLTGLSAGDLDGVLQVCGAVALLDLLDGGAKPQALNAMTAAVTKAGHAPAHFGHATGQHPTTEVFYAPLFEPEAKALATALALPSTAVKPLTWKTKYGLTLVVGQSTR